MSIQQVSEIEIVKLTPPVTDASLPELLRHKGHPWIEDIQNRFDGAYANSCDRFFVAYAAGRAVANVWYTVSATDPRIGLLGHVFTRPDFRRQGIATRLMEAAVADFTAGGGTVLQLTTSNREAAVFYAKLRYEPIHLGPALDRTFRYMRGPIDAQAMIEKWFGPSSHTVRDLHVGDLSKYCLLYNVEYDTELKDWTQSIASGIECEFAFIDTITRIAKTGAVCCVMENSETIVGVGSLTRNAFAPQAHVGAVDFYMHPNFRLGAAELLKACLARAEASGLEIVYAMCVDDEKKRVFANLGFTKTQTLERHFRCDGRFLDCDLYMLQFTQNAPGTRPI